VGENFMVGQIFKELIEEKGEVSLEEKHVFSTALCD
jgi:hypothetical protein